ncbi:hypothetical protein A9Q94_08990 [Rhodobacterales bacterium 56_14_T64]|nr:hypothetical protein A9Q94_08990 [Rhodobacterales bacterium 56_14_T64]
MAARSKIPLEYYLAISRAVAGELDFQNVLNKIAEAVQSKLLLYDHLDVAIVSPGDSSMHVAFETGVETHWGKTRDTQPNDLSPVRHVLNGKVSHILTGDAWEDDRFHFEGASDAPIYEANLHSRMHVPLYVHGEVLGTLNVSSHRKNAYTDEDLAITQNIADLISPYVYALNMSEQARVSALAEGAARGREQSLRVGALRLTEAMEAERQRLGMELHDQTLAELSAVYHQVTRLSEQPKPKPGELGQIADSIAHSISELRGIIENAKPGVLELFGLTQAIEAQLERATIGIERAVKVSVTDATDDLLDGGPDPIRTAVFRIVQEAVTNAIKHSRCSWITVKLTSTAQHIRIVVANDGDEPAEGWRRSSGGVDNIRIRAALISSHVEFSRNANGIGSQTDLTIPLSALTRSPESDDPSTTRLHKFAQLERQMP